MVYFNRVETKPSDAKKQTPHQEPLAPTRTTTKRHIKLQLLYRRHSFTAQIPKHQPEQQEPFQKVISVHGRSDCQHLALHNTLGRGHRPLGHLWACAHLWEKPKAALKPDRLARGKRAQFTQRAASRWFIMVSGELLLSRECKQTKRTT